MTKKILKAYLTETGQPMLCEESQSYNVDCRRTYDNPELLYELALQLGCDRMAEESLYCLCLNSQLKPVGLFLVSSGTATTAIFSARELFQKALLLGAVSIVLWHNHPSGDPTPSQIDIEQTGKINTGGKILGITLVDHIVVGRGCYISLQQEGLL